MMKIIKTAFYVKIALGIVASLFSQQVADASLPRTTDTQETCDILVFGGGLAGAATAYEALLAGRTVCLTDITDWVGGQISSQGTSALDERQTQRSLLFFPRGYLELRDRIKEKYGILNPGGCWVSESCFRPYNGHAILSSMLEDAAKQGKGTLKWFPNTVPKYVEIADRQILSAIAIQHQAAPGTPPLNTEPLSQIIEDAYTWEDSPRLTKTIIEFLPANTDKQAANWYVVEATETGEIIGMTNIPHNLGIDPRNPLEPTSSSVTGDPYCTQGFTYTFAMKALAEPEPIEKPPFYERYAPYYSYELQRLANFTLVFTYRRIHTENPEGPFHPDPRRWTIYPGDISMQNWTWGNDYRPGTSQDNLILTPRQLAASGQLEPGNWMGGLRVQSLRYGEENAKGFFYWLVKGTTDSQLGDGVKNIYPNHRFLRGFDQPMGTAHGLSKFPYMREARRIIGRPSFGQPQGFMIWETDISRNDFAGDFYRENLSASEFRELWMALAGLELPALVARNQTVEQTSRRGRSTIYPDTVGIGHYAIDFHPCMTLSPHETPGNTEREGERLGQGQAYPFQIPLRAMIPQEIDNLLVVGKSIATSHIAAAAYRVHSFEWSSGAAAGMTAVFAFENDVFPYQLVADLPRRSPLLDELQWFIQENGNPIAFPRTSLFNRSWENWR